MADVSVYVDGFNLYHGAKELMRREAPGQSWKWLDLRAVAQRLAPRDRIRSVRYFTATVSSPPGDVSAPQRQQTYIRALRALPDTSVHFGQFVVRDKAVPLVQRLDEDQVAAITAIGLPLHLHPDGNATVRAWRTEEKGSDVNLATFLLADAFRVPQFEKAMVISNDTDLCEPIRLVAQELGAPVVVVNPRGHHQPAAALQRVASETRRLRAATLLQCQLPDQLEDENGIIVRPSGW